MEITSELATLWFPELCESSGKSDSDYNTAENYFLCVI
jgi:hypothetical protein